MIALVLVLRRIQPPRFEEGDRFRAFVLAYCAWRVLIDFLKPGVHVGGLSMLQWSCTAALLWYARDLYGLLQRPFTVKEALADG